MEQIKNTDHLPATTDLRRLLRIIRFWWWIFCCAILLGGITAYWLSIRQPARYQASTLLLIEESYSPSQAVASQDVIIGERANTYIELFRRDLIIEYLSTQEGFSRDSLDKSIETISAQRLNRSQLYEIVVVALAPSVAYEVTNRLPSILNGQINTLQASRFAESRVSLEAQMALLQEQIEAAELGISTAQTVQERNSEQNNLAQYQATFSSLLQSFEQLRLLEVQTLDQINVMRSAELPTEPESRNIFVNVILGILIGASIAALIVSIIEYLDDRIQSPQQLQQALQVVFLGAIGNIPNIPDAENIHSFKHTLITAIWPRHPIAEAYRTIRTNLHFANVDGGVNTFLVTSPSPGDGKSTTTANVAISMAQMGMSVLLVDADLRKPSLHRLFHVANRGGLSSALLDHTNDFMNHVNESGVPCLSLMTSGALPPNPAELIGSQRMGTLIEQFQQQFDIVIFDTPPVLAVTDAAVLATLIKNSILVVHAKRTKQGILKQANDLLNKVDSHLLGIIMNDLQKNSYNYYDYQSYYTYSEYGYGVTSQIPADNN